MSQENAPKHPCNHVELQLRIGVNVQTRAHLLRHPFSEIVPIAYEEPLTEDWMLTRCGPHSHRRNARISRLGRGS
jgi:hypothetical protein